MRASSDSIAQLAAAMARAQSELVNPVKSLTAVFERGRNGNGGTSYRYAPLSAGLDIVRKTLGKHELAVIQTTHIDRERGLVLLTTTIAHGSGDWISALWPVCHISDIGHPKLMGAALTYARRYCLFTMVGLAGEDDMDAPDLDGSKEDGAGEDVFSPTVPTEVVVAQRTDDPKADGFADLGREQSADASTPERHPFAGAEPTRVHDPQAPPRKRKYTRRTRSPSYTFPRSGDPARDLARIEDADALFRWALQMLPARNKFDEAQRAEFDAAFLARADAIGADPELLIPFGSHRVPRLFENGLDPPPAT
ncbi:ERF superfamily protein [Rhizobiales bacterium GAS191]|nr:ERF superfamily protein [Rhizobiales bacterium GAS191]